MSKIRQIAGLALLAVGLLLMHAESLISLVNEARSPKDLGAVTSWCYQPDAVDFKTSNKSGCDVLVIDADDATRTAYSSKSLAPVRMNSDGTRRTVLAYLDIGEADAHRPYWRHAWQANPPAWIVRQNEAWRGNFKVRYWSPQWQRIIYGGSDSRLASILKSGFDGVYLDNVDAYADLLPENPEARSQMVAFVANLAQEARAKRPGFKVIVQGAEELLTDSPFLTSLTASRKRICCLVSKAPGCVTRLLTSATASSPDRASTWQTGVRHGISYQIVDVADDNRVLLGGFEPAKRDHLTCRPGPPGRHPHSALDDPLRVADGLELIDTCNRLVVLLQGVEGEVRLEGSPQLLEVVPHVLQVSELTSCEPCLQEHLDGMVKKVSAHGHASGMYRKPCRRVVLASVLQKQHCCVGHLRLCLRAD